jgi:prophage regulatory protein
MFRDMSSDGSSSTSTPVIRFIREPELKTRTGLTASVIDKMEAAGEFPKRVSISDRVVAWVEAEIDAWQRDRIATRDDAAKSERLKLMRSPTPARRLLQAKREREHEPEAAGPI